MVPAVNLVYSVETTFRSGPRPAAPWTVPSSVSWLPSSSRRLRAFGSSRGTRILVPAEIVGGDLRVDWYPGIGELISVGWFLQDSDGSHRTGVHRRGLFRLLLPER